jgi:hypothetical protein
LKIRDTVDYVRYRIEHAGGDPEIFRKSACAVVHYFSRGIPRLINTLCDFSLVYAYADETRHVDAKMVMDVVRDKQKGGIFPMREEEDEEAARIRTQLKQKLNLDIKPMLAKKDIFNNVESSKEIEDLF